MSLRRSLAFSFLEKYGSTAINIASTLVLARLLTPTEIGVFSVGAALVGLMHSLRDFGVTNYLIQERALDRDKIRTAFTVTLALSWAMALLLVAASGWATRFYGEEGLRQVIWVLAANFALIPFGSPALALMRRELRFGQLGVINLASTAVNAGAAVLLAALGVGFMSLAWASLAGVVATSGLAFIWRPGSFVLKPGVKEWRSILSFGGYASAIALAGEVRSAGPSLILGRALGLEAVGLFSRATGLLSIFSLLIIQGLQPVLLPALAEKARKGEDLRETYLRAMELFTALYWPFLVFLALMADPIVRILLGDQWLAAIPLVRILSLMALIGFAGFMTHPLLMALGHIRDSFLLNLVLAPVTLVMLVLGALHSLEMVAWLTGVSAGVGLIATLVAVHRRVAFGVVELARRLLKSIYVTLIAAAAPAAALGWAGWQAPFGAFLLAGVGFAALWGLAVFLTRHPVRAEIERIASPEMRRLLRNHPGRRNERSA